MKFVLENGQNILIHAYEAGSISVAGIRPDSPLISAGTLDKWDADEHLGILNSSCLISSNGSIESWKPQSLSELTPDDLLVLSANNPEVVLIGTGKNLEFPAPDCLAVLQQQNLGYEIMDTAAACRTFNVLVTEGRSVTLATIMI